ncbi:IMEF encapsulin system ferritin-like cargo protein [Fictibacillus sp. NRS-1165]|uniref:IMEF encapsulin system ferritin-like cargo protein n=1 Tax=Fictibacillus sp. NRS-1165 TaxID=3144463 RepID=UPI003D1E0025
MKEELNTFFGIFSGTKDAIEKFMNMLDPVIQNAKDDHERLYYHHIYEEEEQRLSRLGSLIPLISKFQKETDDRAFSPANNEFNKLLQELNLEKFGLHNFVEHLDLALFSFTDEERSTLLKELRAVTYQDYQQVKTYLQEINDMFDTDYTDPHAHHDEHHDHLAPQNFQTQTIQTPRRKGFTVGSLL